MGGYVTVVNNTRDGSSLTFTPGHMTLVECEAGSLYNDFMAKLGDVATYVIEDDKLYLILEMVGGDMVFGRSVSEGKVDYTYTFENGTDGREYVFVDLPVDGYPEFHQLLGYDQNNREG